MPRQSRRRVVLSLVVATLATLAIGCRAPWAKLQEDVGRYVKDVRQPLARLSEWVGSLGAFYSEARAGDLTQVACTSGRLTALIDEGGAAMADLDKVEPTSVVASIHDRVMQGGRDLVGKLTKVRTLLCENGDVAGAKAALDDVGGAIDEAPGWLGKLSSWLQEQ